MSKIELMVLPYAVEALEPVISRQTVEVHHGKHLQTYVNNLNAALPGTAFEGMALEEIMKQSERLRVGEQGSGIGAIFNNAGQILNHNLYFKGLREPREDNRPTGKVGEAIARQYGSFEAFQKEFAQKGVTLFGSGWVWLSTDKDGELVITQEQNAQNPVTKGLKPLLTFDVWEHAYYLDYQNRRADHLSAMWRIVNWDVVELRISL